MPGTHVHLAFSGMLAATLLGGAFDRRALLVVCGVTAVPDLDAFIALFSVAGHRTVLHTLVVPVAGAVLLWIDTSVRERSVVRDRWGRRGVSVTWVALLAYVVSGIGLDFVAGGVNPLYPVVDQFYTLDGKIQLSDQRGIVQTFVEFDGGLPAPEGLGSSQDVNISTGIDPAPSGGETDPERTFLIVNSGWELLLLVVGTAVTWARLRLPVDWAEK